MDECNKVVEYEDNRKDEWIEIKINKWYESIYRWA